MVCWGNGYNIHFGKNYPPKLDYGLGDYTQISKDILSFKIVDRHIKFYKNEVEFIERHVKDIRGGLDDVMYYEKNGLIHFLNITLGIKEVK